MKKIAMKLIYWQRSVIKRLSMCRTTYRIFDALSYMQRTKLKPTFSEYCIGSLLD